MTIGAKLEQWSSRIRGLSTGYAGSPPGQTHCDHVGHLMKRVVDEENNISQHCLRTIHAEANASAQAAKLGIPRKAQPCTLDSNLAMRAPC